MKPINVKHYEHYFIDESGNVYNHYTKNGYVRDSGPKQLKSFPNKNTGYHQIVLQNKKAGLKPKIFYIHRLVGLTYLPNPNNLPEINHIIPDKNNNSVGNLEWVSKEENNKHKKVFGNNSNTKVSRLLNETKLINKGIKHYNKHNNIDYLASLWNCSDSTARTILNRFGIKRENLRYSTKELEDLRNCILEWGNKKHYSPKFLKYVQNKLGFKTSHHMIKIQKKYLKDLYK